MSLGLWLAALLLAAVAAVVTLTMVRGRKQSTVYSKVEQLTDRIEELTLRMVSLELDVSGYRVWSARLRGQVIELGGEPVPPPPWLIVPGDGRRVAPGDNLLVTLYHRINDHFNEEEINNLAFEIGLEADQLPGDEKSSRARQLVEYAYRNYRLVELTRVARRARPEADWPPVAAVLEYQSSIGKE